MLDIFIENNVVGLDHQQIRRKYNDLKSKKKRRFADIVSACLFNFNKRQDVFFAVSDKWSEFKNQNRIF